MNVLTWPERLGVPLAADLASSALAGIACFAVLWWIARTPGRSLLERRSIPLLATLGAVYFVRIVGWVQAPDSIARWAAFWPSTFLPLMMGLFVEGLLRRHLPLWLKGWVVGVTALFVALHVIPKVDLGPILKNNWPIGMAVTMGLLARQMWLMRNAGLSRQEQRLIGGVVIATLIAIPLVATDGGAWHPDPLPIRLGALGGLLFLRALVTPPGGDGVRDAVMGTLRVLFRALLISGMVLLVVPTASPTIFGVALELALVLILVFEVFDRLRRRRRSEVETQLLHWLATAPASDFDGWRRAIRHAPLVGDAMLLDGETLGHYDSALLALALEKHGPIVSASRARLSLAAAAPGEKEGLEQALDLLSVHDATHAGLISRAPLRILATNLPHVAGRDSELHLSVILRTGQEAAARTNGA